jgi:ATP-dependent DNA helicase RecG
VTLFTEAELRALLQREEGQVLDFKSLWDKSVSPAQVIERRVIRDWIAEYVAAFANADGGTLVLGVDDDGTPSGHGYPGEAIAEFLAVPERRLRPAVRCQTQRAVLDGRELLVFQVGIAAEAVMVDGNGFPYRVGDQVIREPQEVINERKAAYRRVGWERRLRPDANLADLDLDLARDFLKRTVFGDRPVEETLERYNLIMPAPMGGAALTNASLLLFARDPVQWHPRPGIRFFRVAGKERLHGTRRNVTQLSRVERPLTAAIAEAQRLAREQIRRSEKLHDLFFREMPEYPDFAWQEAIVNAFAHRDYEEQGREIEVWFYDDRMEVKSPGELVPPVTVEKLRERKPLHASRNPLLVRLLVEAGLMREEGEGIPRMFEEMEESFLHVPAIVLDSGELTVTLKNEPVFEGPSAEWQHIVQGLNLSTAQKRVLLARPLGFTNEDYRAVNGVDRDQAYREIQEMVAAGAVAPSGAHGRGAVYHVAPDLHGQRVFLEGRLPALRRYFEQRPMLKNADYRLLFDATREMARRELGQLVELGFLVRKGERRGAHYLPAQALAPRA